MHLEQRQEARPAYELLHLCSSRAMDSVRRLVDRVAPTPHPVHLEGETGAGKEVVAQAIHERSGRKGNFVVADCTTYPRELIESYLYGHERGSFTGALQQRTGFFEEARDGTVFVDEIGQLPLDLQPKLLRIIRTGTFCRVGGTKQITTNARVVTASNVNLTDMVRQGRFRQDLYFRVNVYPICVPPLRQRYDDVLPLAEYFLRMHSLDGHTLTLEAQRRLLGHQWPGNVRELENVMCQALVNAGEERRVNTEHLTGIPKTATEALRTSRVETPEIINVSWSDEAVKNGIPFRQAVQAVERAMLMSALRATNGNRYQAAILLKMPIKSAYLKCKQYGIDSDTARNAS